jgi:hypothetical protein
MERAENRRPELWLHSFLFLYNMQTFAHRWLIENNTSARYDYFEDRCLEGGRKDEDYY